MSTTSDMAAIRRELSHTLVKFNRVYTSQVDTEGGCLCLFCGFMRGVADDINSAIDSLDDAIEEERLAAVERDA